MRNIIESKGALLRAATAKLTAAAEAAARDIEAAEAILAACSPGVRAEVVLLREEFPEWSQAEDCLLAYGPFDGGDRIHIVRCLDDPEGLSDRGSREKRLAWRSTSQDVILAAQAALPDLLDAMTRLVEGRVPELEPAVQEAQRAEDRAVLK